jgi:hypothetical protein
MNGYPQRRSWTTKTRNALVLETKELAEVYAHAKLGGAMRALKVGYSTIYSSSERGWVIYNQAGTKMIADR